MSVREDSAFVRSLTAAQLKSVFTVDERAAVVGALRFLIDNVQFLWPLHANALSISLEHRDSFTNALLNCFQRLGLVHLVVLKMVDFPARFEGDVLNGFVRLFMFQHGVEFSKDLFGKLLRAVASSTDVPDEETVRSIVQSFLSTCTNGVTLMPRGLRALVYIFLKSGGVGEAKKVLFDRFFIPLVSAAVEFGVVDADVVTLQGRAALVSVARSLQATCRNAASDSLVLLVAEGNWEEELSPMPRLNDVEDSDMSFLVASASSCCENAVERLIDDSFPVSEDLALQFDRDVKSALCGAAREWERRNKVAKAVSASQTDEVLGGVESLISARLGRDVHEHLCTLKSKLEDMRTFQLLTKTKLNKRAHPTQWQIHGGALSDLMKGMLTFGTIYAELRFALKSFCPAIANAMLEEDRLAELLAAHERSCDRDLVELLVKLLGGAFDLVASMQMCCPPKGHPDYHACLAAVSLLEKELELVERGEIESLLRSYKFQKFTVSGWKLIPKSLSGGSKGLCSVLRRHLIAGLVLHGTPKPARFFAQLFSDVLVLCSQIELAESAENGSSPRVHRVRSGSLARVSGKEKKRVLMRMGSETTMQMLQQRKLISPRRPPPILFKIEKVIELDSIVIELQLLNKGFCVDGFEFTVCDSREVLMKWFAALRVCECKKLIDTATVAAEAVRSSSVIAEETPDDDFARMMDEFEVFGGGDGGSMVVRTREDGDGGKEMERVLDQIKTEDPSPASSERISSLLALFIPPPEVEKKEKEQKDEEEEEAANLAKMLKNSKFSLRLLRETK